jgi:hypothetical protein
MAINLNEQKTKEIIENIAKNAIETVKKSFNINNIEIKKVEDLELKAHKKTFWDMDKDNYVKHYLILDTEKILSIPVFAIKKNNRNPIFRSCDKISFRRNIVSIPLIGSIGC